MPFINVCFKIRFNKKYSVGQKNGPYKFLNKYGKMCIDKVLFVICECDARNTAPQIYNILDCY